MNSTKPDREQSIKSFPNPDNLVNMYLVEQAIKLIKEGFKIRSPLWLKLMIALCYTAMASTIAAVGIYLLNATQLDAGPLLTVFTIMSLCLLAWFFLSQYLMQTYKTGLSLDKAEKQMQQVMVNLNYAEAIKSDKTAESD